MIWLRDKDLQVKSSDCVMTEDWGYCEQDTRDKVTQQWQKAACRGWWGCVEPAFVQGLGTQNMMQKTLSHTRCQLQDPRRFCWVQERLMSRDSEVSLCEPAVSHLFPWELKEVHCFTVGSELGRAGESWWKGPHHC